jgi:predicted ATP-grasp superfamily ATP-dependent carboligase
MLALTYDATVTVLIHEWVTGGGLAGQPLPPSWASEGRAMRRAIAADFAAIAAPPRLRVIVTLDSRLPDEPGPWVIERVAPEESFKRLHDLARAADFTVLIAPETTGILAQLTRELHAAGVRTMGSTAEAVELVADKARLAALLKHAGIATPVTRIVTPADSLPLDAEYPAVLKPIDGAGSLNTYWIANPYRVPREACTIPVAVLQPFIFGAPMSASFLIGPDGEAHLIGIGAQRMAIRDGRFEYGGGMLPISCPGVLPQLEPAIASIEGLRGFVGIDFLWQPEKEHAIVLEINPRPTTSYVGLSRVLGPGILARAWLALYHTSAQRNLAHQRDLANRVYGHQPVSFDANGNFSSDGQLSE